MTTDITELAQSLKAAAVRVIKNYDSEWFEAGHQICTVHKSKINLISLANPVSVLALVEELEKAQTKADVYDMLRDDYGLREKGVGLADFVDWQANRIAELESRTVKLPDDEDGQAYGFAKWSNSKLPATAGTMTIAYCEDAWRAAFEVFSSAAGIKVEAE
ncbi:hypothetical protein QZN18_20685 [Klebsiella variicola]|uniref:hypothetical protein n=1 Tax=Klebsiella variicola TaxID=244366 RepID=UPI00265FF39C|nr:hypothetical protein [Klebsiella variicola]WKL60402.1 hypothetical protein QZN18_20685 [Klebsiella variicola]